MTATSVLAAWPDARRPVTLADLAPVGLADLTRDAALLARTDRKYVVGADAVPALLGRLSGRARVLDIDGDRSFAYESDYFDSPDLRCFLDTAHRRRRRFKVRTRRYADSGLSFLEVKIAVARGTAKRRLAWHGQVLDAEARAFVAATLADAGIADVPPLVPTLRTTYRRSTLHLPHDGARVTLDSGLAWQSLRDGSGGRLGRLVVETKTSAGPCAADRLLWAWGQRPRPLSKYATGLAALDPSLPRNRWHRLLTPASPVAS